MSEVPLTRNDHDQTLFFAIFNTVLITDRAAGLYKSGNTGFVAKLHTIVERKESIAGHNSAGKIEMKLPRLFHRLAQGINAAGLPATFTNQLLILNQSNRIAF